MANTNRVNGFTLVEYNPKLVRTFYKAAGTTVTNDMGVGDLVVMSGSGDAAGVPGVTKSTAGDANPSVGVVVGVMVQPTHLDRAAWIDGADTGYVRVCVDPDAIYEAQADAALTYTDINQNANMVQTNALSRTSGVSGQEVDATVGTGATYQLKILGFVQRADNAINALYNRVLVKINNHQWLGGTGTAGA